MWYKLENLLIGEKKMGFQHLTPEERQKVARSGAHAGHKKGTAHELTDEEGRRAGKKGRKNFKKKILHEANGDKELAKQMIHDYFVTIGRKGGSQLKSPLRLSNT